MSYQVLARKWREIGGVNCRSGNDLELARSRVFPRRLRESTTVAFFRTWRGLRIRIARSPRPDEIVFRLCSSGNGSASNRLSQPFQQSFKLGHALANFRLTTLYSGNPLT